MQPQIVQYLLIALFLSVFVLIGIGWLTLGAKTYGTGDYHQP